MEVIHLNRIYHHQVMALKELQLVADGLDAAAATFAAADTNQDGKLDQAEFRKFLQSGL